MEEYLNCTFRDIPIRPLIAFSSDEVDPSYRRGIQTLVEMHGQYLDLDETVQEYLTRHIERRTDVSLGRRNNNFLVFEIIRTIAERAIFRLEQRRHIRCHDCDRDYLIQSVNMTS
jgi:hypothetical protein